MLKASGWYSADTTINQFLPFALGGYIAETYGYASVTLPVMGADPHL